MKFRGELRPIIHLHPLLRHRFAATCTEPMNPPLVMTAMATLMVSFGSAADLRGTHGGESSFLEVSTEAIDGRAQLSGTHGTIYAWYFVGHAFNARGGRRWGVKIGRTNDEIPAHRMNAVGTAVRNHMDDQALVMERCSNGGDFNNFVAINRVNAVDACIKSTLHRSADATADFNADSLQPGAAAGPCRACATTEWYALSCADAIRAIQNCFVTSNARVQP